MSSGRRRWRRPSATVTTRRAFEFAARIACIIRRGSFFQKRFLASRQSKRRHRFRIVVGHQSEALSQQRAQHQLRSIGLRAGRSFGNNVELVHFQPARAANYFLCRDAVCVAHQIDHRGVPELKTPCAQRRTGRKLRVGRRRIARVNIRNLKLLPKRRKSDENPNRRHTPAEPRPKGNGSRTGNVIQNHMRLIIRRFLLNVINHQHRHRPLRRNHLDPKLAIHRISSASCRRWDPKPSLSRQRPASRRLHRRRSPPPLPPFKIPAPAKTKREIISAIEGRGIQHRPALTVP